MRELGQWIVNFLNNSKVSQFLRFPVALDGPVPTRNFREKHRNLLEANCIEFLDLIEYLVFQHSIANQVSGWLSIKLHFADNATVN